MVVPAIPNLLAVIVHLKPTGGAPVLKILKFKVRNFIDVHPRPRLIPYDKFSPLQVSGDRKLATVADSLRKQLERDSVVSCGKLGRGITLLATRTDPTAFLQFLYLKEAFCPSLEERLSVLAEVSAAAALLLLQLVHFSTLRISAKL